MGQWRLRPASVKQRGLRTMTTSTYDGGSSRQHLLHRALAAIAAFGLVCASSQVSAEPPKTIEPGKLTIGFKGDMPMTGLKDGKLIGTDGALLAKIAADLGLEVKPVQMEWSALIQATKQGKVDIMLGSMGWTVDRTKILLMTDPIYYFGTYLLQKKATNYS